MSSSEPVTVLIPRPVPETAIARLKDAGLAVKVRWRPQALSAKRLREVIGRFDAVLSQIADPLDEPMLAAAAPRCKVIAQCAVGYDNIDIAAAKRLGIIITNTPDVLTEAVADLTWALLLATARRTGESERVLRAGGWRGWHMLDFLGTDVFGKTLGLIGAGRIGTAVARRASGFRMPVVYWARSEKPEMAALGARRVELNELLSQSDFVSINVSLNDATRGLIDAAAISRMKKGAYLINASRGAIVDEQALIAAIRSGHLAGAGLDVYRSEPNFNRELLDLPNVVLLPHIGSATVETRNRMAALAADNIVAVLNGRPPLTPVT